VSRLAKAIKIAENPNPEYPRTNAAPNSAMLRAASVVVSRSKSKP
jgi:hypothetical protein